MSRYSEHPPLNQSALRELVEGGLAPFKTTPRSYILWCPEPSCQRQKLYVERITGLCKCFRCGLSGWANWVLSRVYSRSPEELNELLYGIVSSGTFIDTARVRPDFWGEEEVEDSLLPEPPKYPPIMARDPMWCELDDALATSGLAYLENRGVPLDIAKIYGIGFNVAEQRVVFPVIVDKQLRGWQSRYIHPTEMVGDGGKIIRIPKAVTTGKLGKECFMFQDRLVGASQAILTEGPFDAIKCHLIPGNGNIASMGKDVSKRQLDLIVRSGVKKLYIGLDRDAANEVSRIIKVLNGVVELYRLLPPLYRTDLGECTMQEVLEQFLDAEHLGAADEHQTYRPAPKLWV